MSSLQGVTNNEPLSYNTVFYEVIAKVLASRLVDLVGRILYQAQATFVQG